MCLFNTQPGHVRIEKKKKTPTQHTNTPNKQTNKPKHNCMPQEGASTLLRAFCFPSPLFQEAEWATPSLAITAARTCLGHQIARAQRVAASDWGNKDWNQRLHTAIFGSLCRHREKQLWFWRGRSPRFRASNAIWAVLSEWSKSSQSIFWSWSACGCGQCYSCRLWNKHIRGYTSRSSQVEYAFCIWDSYFFIFLFILAVLAFPSTRSVHL